jgi:hypothetical protein
MGLFSRVFGVSEQEVTTKPQSKGIGYVARGGVSWKKIDDLPQDESIQLMYIKAYANFGIIAKIIDGSTEQVVQDFYFDGPNAEKLELVRKQLNIDSHFFTVCKTLLKHGNCWVEVVGSGDNLQSLKILPPEEMSVIREATGKILAYVQTTGTKSIVWGRLPEGAIQGKFVVAGDIKNIIHYMFNRQAGEKYGQSLIRPALRMLQVREQIEKDLPVIMQRYLSPIIVAYCGNDESPVSQEQILDVKDKLKNIYADTEYAVSHLIKFDVLGFKDKGVIPLAEIFKIIDTDIMMAMGMYPVLVGKESVGDTKSAETQLRSESRHIKAIQRELKTEFEDKFIIGLGIGNEKDSLVWAHTDERELVEHIANVIQVYGAGLITRQKANELLPKQFHEELPEDADGLAQGTLPTPPPTNPNDPTQSTSMISGQRVKRDDHRNPLDKKVKDTGKSQHEVSKK